MNRFRGRRRIARLSARGVCALLGLTILASSGRAAGLEKPLLSLDSIEGARSTWTTNTARTLEVVNGEGESTDGDGAIRFGGAARDVEGNQYFGLMIPLPRPVNLKGRRLVLDARCDTPETLKSFYVRAYNQGEKEPAWSFNGMPFTATGSAGAGDWRTVTLQREVGMPNLRWEKSVVADREAKAVDRVEIILGTNAREGRVAVRVDNLRIGPALARIADLKAPRNLIRETPLVQSGTGVAVILHPDSPAGREAAALLVAAVRERTGVTLEARAGTAADREPERTAILLGSLDTNPALLLLYARYLTPVDAICPGTGGALVHTVFDPFGRGANAIVVGGSDDAGLREAAGLLADAIAQRPRGDDLELPRLFNAKYGADFLKRYGWAGRPPAADRLEEGLKEARKRLDEGTHTALAGQLRTIASRYLLTGESVEAKLFVAVWDLYAQSAVADPSRYGGPWGFDSDFPSSQVVAGWDVIEHDPSLTDAERLRVTKSMARWLTEAVIPKCAGAVKSSRVLFNHQTFPALGALFAGLYFSQGYDTIEGRDWLGMADAIFQRQAGYFKSHEDCNSYQWLTNGHVMRYAVARPDFTLFENGNARRIVDYCIGNMDNLSYQVPYGDTGSWRCTRAERLSLDIFSFMTQDPASTWAAAFKRRVSPAAELFAFNRIGEGVKPDRFDGVRVWPLEPAYYATFPAEGRPPLERCFDKISFREAMDPDAAYLLLDGLGNGGHGHHDGNGLSRLTQFDRIWLADNDYFKSHVKYHNSLLVFRDGESGPLPDYTELLGAGASPRHGFSRTRLTDYAGVDWDRTVVWLKRREAFVVLDRVVPRAKGRYQLRLLWHGVGAAKLDDGGLLLSQKGPSLRLDLAPGPESTLYNDEALGENWRGYPHADPVVRSLSATASVELEAGEPYLFATALHGRPEGTVEPWRLRPTAGADGVEIQTDQGNLAIVLGPLKGWPEGPGLKTDAGVIVIDEAGLTLLGGTRAKLGDVEIQASEKPESIDTPRPNDAPALGRIPTREPKPNITAGVSARPLPLLWERRLTAPPESGEGDAKGSKPASSLHVTRLAAARLDPKADEPSLLVATREGFLLARRPDGESLWEAPIGSPINDVTAADLDRDGRDEIVLAREDWHVGVLDGAGKELWKQKLEYYRRPANVNLVRTGDLDGDGVPEVVAGAENWRFYAYKADGEPLWNYESVHPSRSGAVVDLDGDGKCEVLCGTHYYWFTALSGDGARRWRYRCGPICHDIATGDFDGDQTRGVVLGGGDGYVHYLSWDGEPRMKFNTGDEVKAVLTADTDGDGRDEIYAGSMSHYVYRFDANGARRWALDLGGPISALEAVRTADGRPLVAAGTRTGRLVTLDGDGTIQAASPLGSAVVDLLSDGDTLLVATEDGNLRRLRIEATDR